MRTKLGAAATLMFVIIFYTSAFSADFWASSKSNKYHSPSCQWAQKINPKNLVKFSSPEQAQKTGFIPCKVCKPLSASKSENNVENCFEIVKITFDDNDPERRGCCSWHGGVCGCSGSRALCCDGSLSPSCGCD